MLADATPTGHKHMSMRFTGLNRYSRWDGTQLPELSPEDVLSALSEDLMEFGDLEQAMRYLMQRGMDGQQIQGLRDMLKQLKNQRTERLERYDMGSVLEDIKRQLDEILDLEQQSIQEWQNQQADDGDASNFIDNLKRDLGDDSEPVENTDDFSSNLLETSRQTESGVSGQLTSGSCG